MTFWRGKEIIPINLGMAVIWFTRSARQGYAPSHWALGQIALENGDLHIAIAWWETAMKLNSNDTSTINVDQLLTTTCDSDALVILGKIIQNQQESVLCTQSSAASLASDTSSRDEAESFSRAQQENHGLALRCFGQAALMGNVDGMYLTAQAWHKDKDYPVALENYERAASQGHVPSRIMCATYQIYGLGGKETNAHAGFHELLDCAQHDSDAFLHLGRCCERGLGTSQDMSKALQWYHLSIDENDDSEAMFRVGQIHAAAALENKEQGDMDAMYWYQRAISKDNHPRANFRIAFYYIHGIQSADQEQSLLEPDLDIAVHHLRIAAKQNDQDAMFELGQLLLREDFSVDQQLEGLGWYEIAADRGSRDAQRELGNLYHTGRGEEDQQDNNNNNTLVIQQDFEKAYDYFSLAAHLGDKTSALFLGTYYEHGIGVAPSIELAQSWYTVAVELGGSTTSTMALPLHDPSGWWPAQLCLARVLHQNEETQGEAYQLFMTIYHTHRPEQHLAYLEFMLALYQLEGLGGVPIQADNAFNQLVHLAEQGYLKAFFPVAQCYENGIGTTKNLLKALEWYVLLVHNPATGDQDITMDEDDLEDLSHAYYHLAEFYRQGAVVAMDTEKADTLYKIAAERGSIEAKEYLSLHQPQPL
ncbi:hypothetical protein MBANPS3_003006 [Mucor bainieri]